jgi:hypothetical protein
VTERIKFFLAVVACCAGLSCRKRESQTPIIVHVIRDPSGAMGPPIDMAMRRFSLTKPHLANGTPIMIAANEGSSYSQILHRVVEARPELLILNSETDLPHDSALRSQLGKSITVCGDPAFVGNWVRGEQREAAEIYLSFLDHACEQPGSK